MLTRPQSHTVMILAAALVLAAGCAPRGSERGATASAAGLGDSPPALAVPAGVAIPVRLTCRLTSETARPGDPWSGMILAAVMVAGREIIPAGSIARGVVTGAQPAARGTRAMLDLAIEDIWTDAGLHPLGAGLEAILAALPRAKESEADTGGTATVIRPGDESDMDPVAVEMGAQVVLEIGTELVFVVKERAAVR